MSHRFKIHIGDWSKDGHNQSESFVVESTVENEEVQQAFKTAALKIGVISEEMHPRFMIADEYEDNGLSNEHAKALTDAGVEIDDLVYNDGTDEEPNYMFEDPQNLAILLMRIAQTELQFEYKFISENIPSFNGYWGGLNMSIGYGLFSC